MSPFMFFLFLGVGLIAASAIFFRLTRSSRSTESRDEPPAILGQPKEIDRTPRTYSGQRIQKPAPAKRQAPGTPVRGELERGATYEIAGGKITRHLRPDSRGGGWEMNEGTRGRILWGGMHPRAAVRAFRVAGTHHRGKEAKKAFQGEAFNPGRRVSLKREPTNKNDPNAIAIYDEAGEVMIGYVPSEFAEDLARFLDRGEEIRAWSIFETRGAKVRDTLYVMAMRDDLEVVRG